MLSSRWTGAVCAAVMLGASGSGAALAAGDPDEVWNGGLRSALFGDRPIVEDDSVIALDTPRRADNAAIVPIRIQARMAQSETRFIETITLVIDRNPVPMGGVFSFTPDSGRAELVARVRINAYTPVRAIAETSDGQLYMSRRFVKASGGCSAPPGASVDAAMRELGKMRLRTHGEVVAGRPLLAQVAVRHPNLTGLQMDQLSRLYMPAHFVKDLRVSFDGKPVFRAQTDISISENPNFRFYFVPGKSGELRADVVDSQGRRFSRTLMVSVGAQGLSALPDAATTVAGQ